MHRVLFAQKMVVQLAQVWGNTKEEEKATFYNREASYGHLHSHGANCSFHPDTHEVMCVSSL